MKERKPVKPVHGILCIAFLTLIMFGSVVFVGLDNPMIPVGIGCVFAGLMASYLGYGWEDIVRFIIEGIRQSVEAILILMSIGVLIGVWIAAGTVPSLIYYGLSIISPRLFLPTAFLACSVISMIVGAWGAAGTVGIAFMGIGVAIGYSPAVVGGAIVAGAYVGDKMSPFSDGTNLAATVSGANVMDVVKRMLPIASVAYIASGILFGILGFTYDLQDAGQIPSAIRPVLDALDASFRISPLALIPLAVMLLLVFFKVPALPGILAGAGVGAVQAILMQRASLHDLLVFCSSGFEMQTGNGLLDSLLSAGGVESMMHSVSIVIVAMSFGGIMQGSGMIHAFVEPLVRKVRTAAGMIPLIIGSCICMNVLLPDQYLGIAVPGTMYREESEKRGMDGALLANTLGSGAAVTSPLIPWNTCGIYITSVLGVRAVQYAPYAFFNYLLPVLFILYGFLRFRTRRKPRLPVENNA